jgi:hypothetical protein
LAATWLLNRRSLKWVVIGVVGPAGDVVELGDQTANRVAQNAEEQRVVAAFLLYVAIREVARDIAIGRELAGRERPQPCQVIAVVDPQRLGFAEDREQRCVQGPTGGFRNMQEDQLPPHHRSKIARRG